MADPTGSDALLARMMALHPTEIDLSLDRMWRLLGALDHPERRLPPVIHIAGTNGKGSTVAMLRAGLRSAGLRVQAYTSPHLVAFHERIELAGGPIDEAALCAVLDHVLTANGGHAITFFEATTAAALLAFADTPADILLLEVGLGGRLDATNVVQQPRLSVITPVDLDHQDFLGTRLEEIAAEKAGILKRGVPCVVGRQHDAALEVIEACAQRVGAPLLVRGQHWHVRTEHGRLVFEDERGLLDLPLPVLPGAHQIDNAGMVLAVLRGLGQPEHVCAAALTQARWPARMELLRNGALSGLIPQGELWLDGGHNPAAARVLADVLAGLPPRRLHLLVGLQIDKDRQGFLAPLLPLASSLTALPVPGARGGSVVPADLAAIARAANLPEVHEVPDADTALRHLADTDPRARVLICGSLYLAGAVLRAERGAA